MKVLKVLGLILLVIVVVVAVLAFVAPTEMETERSVKIDAPKELIFEHLVYFEATNRWSPWMELDSNMQTNIEGEDGTVGVVFSWEGNKEAGKGKQELTLIESNRIEHRITFIEPFESRAKTYFELEEKMDGVEVSWGLNLKWFDLLMCLAYL